MVMSHEVMFWLRYGYVMAVAVSQLHASQERINVFAAPMAPQVFFQTLPTPGLPWVPQTVQTA